jgi:hypothetical protein
MGTRAARSGLDLTPSWRRLEIPQGYVVPGGRVIWKRKLEKHRDVPPQLLSSHLLQVVAIQRDATGLWIEKAAEKLEEGGLAGAIGSDNRNNLPCRDEQVEVLKNWFTASRVIESNVVETYTMFQSPGYRCWLGWFDDARLQL